MRRLSCIAVSLVAAWSASARADGVSSPKACGRMLDHVTRLEFGRCPGEDFDVGLLPRAGSGVLRLASSTAGAEAASHSASPRASEAASFDQMLHEALGEAVSVEQVEPDRATEQEIDPFGDEGGAIQPIVVEARPQE